jgi:hypothetical protein
LLVTVSKFQRLIRGNANEMIAQTPYSDRGFSNHTIAALTASGVDCPEWLLFMLVDEIRLIRGVGKSALKEIERYRARFSVVAELPISVVAELPNCAWPAVEARNGTEFDG